MLGPLPDTQTLASFALASLLIELTPGPNMTYLAVVAAAQGRRVGFATVAGVALGLASVGLVAAVGVAELTTALPLVYEGLRWTGVLFLLYLAWDGWTSSGKDDGADPSRQRFFLRGLLTNLLNPKAAIFYVTVLPTFIEADLPALPQSLFLTAIYVAVATLVHGMIVLLAGAIRPLLTDPKRERAIRRVLSAALALVALWFAWSTAR